MKTTLLELILSRLDVQSLRIKSKYAMAILALLMSSTIVAQTDSVLITNFKVLDGFHEEPIENVRVSILEADSTTVLLNSMEERWSTGTVNGEARKHYMGFSASVPLRENYVFRIECDGYPTEYFAQKIKWKKNFLKYVFEKPIYIYPGIKE